MKSAAKFVTVGYEVIATVNEPGEGGEVKRVLRTISPRTYTVKEAAEQFRDLARSQGYPDAYVRAIEKPERGKRAASIK